LKTRSYARRAWVLRHLATAATSKSEFANRAWLLAQVNLAWTRGRKYSFPRLPRSLCGPGPGAAGRRPSAIGLSPNGALASVSGLYMTSSTSTWTTPSCIARAKNSCCWHYRLDHGFPSGVGSARVHAWRPAVYQDRDSLGHLECLAFAPHSPCRVTRVLTGAVS
jgi:hypothetical protein